MNGSVKTIPNEAKVLEQAKRMADAGMTWCAIARELDVGVSYKWLKRRLVPGYREQAAQARRGRPRLASGGYTNPRPISDEALKRYRAAMPQDTRDLTARLMGDPIPGRSALDRKGVNA